MRARATSIPRPSLAFYAICPGNIGGTSALPWGQAHSSARAAGAIRWAAQRGALYSPRRQPQWAISGYSTPRRCDPKIGARSNRSNRSKLVIASSRCCNAAAMVPRRAAAPGGGIRLARPLQPVPQ